MMFVIHYQVLYETFFETLSAMFTYHGNFPSAQMLIRFRYVFMVKCMIIIRNFGRGLNLHNLAYVSPFHEEFFLRFFGKSNLHPEKS